MDSRELALKTKGLECLRCNRLMEAYAVFKAACEQGCNDAEVWYNLAVVSGRLGSLNGVEGYLRTALRLAPDFTDAWLRLAETLAYLGRSAESVAVYRQVLEKKPERDDIWMKLGNILEATGNHAEAIDCYQTITTLRPGYAQAHTAIGNARYFTGDVTAAEQAYAQAYKLDPHNLKAVLGHYLALPLIYRDRDHMLAARARFCEGVAKLRALRDELKGSRSLIEDLQWSYNFYLAYQGLDDKQIQREFGEFFTAMVGHAFPQFMQPLAPALVSARRIRVGYAAHFLHNHTVSFYFNNWIEHADQERFETFVYHINPINDATSQRLAGRCTHYRPIAGAIAGIAQCIRNDALDVLIYPEVGMFSKIQWLAAMRLAPIQCAGWGHPVTTGLANIDYALSATATEPAGAQAHYAEILVPLAGIGVAPVSGAHAADASREQFGLAADRHLYLCPQSLFKIHVDMDRLMVELAQADPKALILLFDDYKPLLSAPYKQRISSVFEQHGLSAERCLQFLPRLSHTDYLRLNRVADVMIDTPHWSGGRTSLDALSAGLPIVTLPGEYSRGRQTAGMLNVLDLPQLVASDCRDYVAKCVAIASDPAQRRRLSEDILQRMPEAIYRNDAPQRSLEAQLLGWIGG